MDRSQMLAVLLSYIVNFLLLLSAGRLSGYPGSFLRCAAAGLLGAAYTFLCLTIPALRRAGAIGRLGCLVAMGAAAYGIGKHGVRCMGLFCLLATALEGLALNMGRGRAGALPCAAGIMWGICNMAFRGNPGRREFCRIELRRGDRSRKLLALRDTGNTLRDPVTGEPVLVVSGEVGTYLTGMTERELSEPLETMLHCCIPGLRLIPYRSVGQRGGLLLALPMEDVHIDGWRGKRLVAFAPYGLGGEEYQALIGG